jgi:hypothetical protein
MSKGYAKMISTLTRFGIAAGAGLALTIGVAAPASAAPPAERTVTIRVVDGQGTVTVNGAAGSTTVPTNFDGYLTVTATPSTGYQFAGVAAVNGVGNDTGGWAGGSSRVRTALVNSTSIAPDGTATAQFRIDAYHVNLQALFVPIQNAPLPIVLPPTDRPGEPTVIYVPGETTVIVTPGAGGGAGAGAPAAGAPAAGVPAAGAGLDADAPVTAMYDEPYADELPVAPELEAPELPITGGYDDDTEAPALAITGSDDYHFEDADGFAATAVLATGIFLVSAIGVAVANRMRHKKAVALTPAGMLARKAGSDGGNSVGTNNYSKFASQSVRTAKSNANQHSDTNDRILL